jgi:hypothetical protein
MSHRSWCPDGNLHPRGRSDVVESVFGSPTRGCFKSSIAIVVEAARRRASTAAAHAPRTVHTRSHLSLMRMLPSLVAILFVFVRVQRAMFFIFLVSMRWAVHRILQLQFFPFLCAAPSPSFERLLRNRFASPAVQGSRARTRRSKPEQKAKPKPKPTGRGTRARGERKGQREREKGERESA